MKKSLLPAFAILVQILPGYAQEARKVAFRTFCVQPHADLTGLWLPAANKKGGGAAKVSVYAGSFSPVTEALFKGADAVFFASEPKDGASLAPVAQGKLAKSARQLFVFVPVTKGGLAGYDIRAFDDDMDSFKLGSVRAVNLATVPVRFTLAGEVLAPIEPSGQVVYPPSKKVNEYGMYPAVVEFKGEGDKWVRIYSTSWKASERRRELVITMTDEKLKQNLVKMFSDDPPWLEKK